MEFIEFLEKNRPLKVVEYGREPNNKPFVILLLRWSDETRKALRSIGITQTDEISRFTYPAFKFHVPKKYVKQVLEMVIDDKRKELARKQAKLNDEYGGRIAILESLKLELKNEY